MITPAELLATELLHHRSRGVSFQRAWAASLREAQAATAHFPEAKGWMTALRWAKPEFEHAYNNPGTKPPAWIASVLAAAEQIAA